jgi:hypothetical protein
MKKFNLLNFSLALTMLVSPVLSEAQTDMYHGLPANYYSDYVGGRVLVTAPGSVAKALNFTISNDGGSTDWGAQIPNNNSMLNLELVKADPYDVCATITNGPSLAGKIALVERGNCEFGAKAYAVQLKNAVACIIVNNVNGGPVGMGAGAQGVNVNIPVIMISKDDGAALVAAMSGNTVKMSLTKWGNGNMHDVGFVDRGLSLWHNFAIPYHQMDVASVAKNAYKGINGAVIANFGSSNETGIVVKAKVTWTPDGGSPVTVIEDSVTRAAFGVGDSIITPFVDNPYSLVGLTGYALGRYDVQYTLRMDNSDDFPNDNSASYSFYVTSSLLAKGRYDFAKGQSFMSSYIGFTTPTDYMMGNLHYIAKKDYQFRNVQFSISKGSATDNDLSTVNPVNIWLYKWVDGSNGQPADNVIQQGETSIVGAASHEFKSGDTSGHVFTVDIADAQDKNKPSISADDSWYWVAADVPSGMYIGVDGESNMQPRTYFRAKATNSFLDYYTILFGGAQSAFTNASDEPTMYPFERGENGVDSSRFSEQKKGIIPALPINMSIFPVSVSNTVAAQSFDISLYPNPASDVLNVSVKLEKKAAKAYYSIVDGLGRSVKREVRENVQNDTYSVTVSDLPAGQYYFTVNANDEVTVRKFTVVK